MQACINAVELAIIANFDRIGYSFESSMHHKSTLQLPMTMMLGKESECAMNAVATAVILTLDHVSPPVSPFFVSHHSRCDTASSLFASKCLGECYAGMAALCDLWDPGWGDPRFPH